MLAVLEWRYNKRRLVLVEPLSYPLVRRDPVGRLFVRREQGWEFAALAFPITLAAAAGVATVWTRAPLAVRTLAVEIMAPRSEGRAI